MPTKFERDRPAQYIYILTLTVLSRSKNPEDFMGLSWKSIGKVFSAPFDIGKNVIDQFTGKAYQDSLNKQNEYNLQMWNMQNAYNTPSAQLQRYRDAGLNPNLIYGSGSASAGNATSAPKSEQLTHQNSFNDLLGLFSTIVGLSQGEKRIKLDETKESLDWMKFSSQLAHQRDVLEMEKKRFFLDSLLKQAQYNNTLEMMRGHKIKNDVVSKTGMNPGLFSTIWSVLFPSHNPGQVGSAVNSLPSSMLRLPGETWDLYQSTISPRYMYHSDGGYWREY